IRMTGIDAPEMQQTCKSRLRTWNCGESATEALKKKVGWAKLRCRKNGVDRYKRILGTCYLNEDNLNEWMVREGWAITYRNDRSYQAAEVLARQNRQGIWDSTFDVPWVWRADQKSTDKK